MLALFSFFTIILLSILVVRIGTVALEITGLSTEVAAFQAQSAFSGVGFTTAEAETVVSHPVRRRIIRMLILLGNAGLSTSIATLILTFIGGTARHNLLRFGLLIGGLLVIYFVMTSPPVHYLIKKWIRRIIQRSSALKLLDYQEILGVSRDYNISRIKVDKDNWMCGRTLAEMRLRHEGVLVLSIHHWENGTERFIGVPDGDTTSRPVTN